MTSLGPLLIKAINDKISSTKPFGGDQEVYEPFIFKNLVCWFIVSFPSKYQEQVETVYIIHKDKLIELAKNDQPIPKKCAINIKKPVTSNRLLPHRLLMSLFSAILPSPEPKDITGFSYEDSYYKKMFSLKPDDSFFKNAWLYFRYFGSNTDLMLKVKSKIKIRKGNNKQKRVPKEIQKDKPPLNEAQKTLNDIQEKPEEVKEKEPILIPKHNPLEDKRKEKRPRNNVKKKNKKGTPFVVDDLHSIMSEIALNEAVALKGEEIQNANQGFPYDEFEKSYFQSYTPYEEEEMGNFLFYPPFSQEDNICWFVTSINEKENAETVELIYSIDKKEFVKRAMENAISLIRPKKPKKEIKRDMSSLEFLLLANIFSHLCKTEADDHKNPLQKKISVTPYYVNLLSLPSYRPFVDVFEDYAKYFGIEKALMFLKVKASLVKYSNEIF